MTQIDKPHLSDDGGGWRKFCAPRPCTPTLSTSRCVRYAVVGAGFTGFAAARELALSDPQAQVLLLDGRTLAAGASGRNAGYAVGISQFGGRVAEKDFAECARINRINAQGLQLLRQTAQPEPEDDWWEESGIHYLAADNQACEEAKFFQEYLQNFSLPGRWMDRTAISHELGTAHYRCGVHVPIGALVQPAKLLYRLQETLPNNVFLFESSPVKKLNVDNSGVNLQLSNGAVVKCEKVILAGNYELAGLNFLRQRIAATTLSGSFTRVLTDEELDSLGTLKSWGILGLHRGGATVRLTRDRRLMLRNCVEFTGGQLLSEQTLAQRMVWHRQRMLARFPQLAQVSIAHSWSGCEGVSGNMTSFFGQYAPGVFLSAGYNGAGLSRGTAMGCALARMLLGGDDPLIKDAAGFAKAQWLPPRPFLDLGAAWYIHRRFAKVGEDV